jgi:hypothetical protein
VCHPPLLPHPRSNRRQSGRGVFFQPAPKAGAPWWRSARPSSSNWWRNSRGRHGGIEPRW